MSVYFPLELPISEENRFIHDNFTGSSTRSRVFLGEEEAFRIVGIAVVVAVAVAGAYAKLFAMERARTRNGVQSDAQRKPIKIARRAFY